MIFDQFVGCFVSAGLTDDQIDLLRDLGYFTAPASKGHHGAFPGGLALHSRRVARHMLELRVFESDRSNFLVGMLHDLVKVHCYRRKEDGSFEYVDPPYPGHGIASALIAQDLGIRLTPAESAAIVWHMGPFDLDEKTRGPYHEALMKFGREIVLTHAADHLSSIEEDLEEAKRKEDGHADA